MQKVSQTKISTQRVPRKKNQHAASSTNKYQRATSSMNKNPFHDEKINIQVSRREKSTCNKFHEQNKFQDEKTNIEVSRR